MIDTNNWGSYFAAANFALTWGLAFYVHLVNKNKATTDRMERLEHDLLLRLNQHGDRLTKVESQLSNMPSHTDLGKLYDRLNDQSRDVARMAGELSQINDNLRLLLRHAKEGQ